MTASAQAANNRIESFFRLLFAFTVGKRLNGRELIMRKREKTKRCIYSDSCFKCPLSDCRMNTPAQLNCLPLDFEPDTKKFKVVTKHG